MFRGDLLQRSRFLNVSDQKPNDSTGAYDGDCKPDDVPKWPAKTVLFPHGDQCKDDKDYGKEYNQQMTYGSECKLRLHRALGQIKLSINVLAKLRT